MSKPYRMKYESLGQHLEQIVSSLLGLSEDLLTLLTFGFFSASWKVEWVLRKDRKKRAERLKFATSSVVAGVVYEPGQWIGSDLEGLVDKVLGTPDERDEAQAAREI